MLETETTDQLGTAIKNIFTQLKKLRQNGKSYSTERFTDLCICFGQDFNEQLKRIYSQVPLLRLDHKEYINFQKEFNQLQTVWANAFADFENTLANTQYVSINERTTGKKVLERVKPTLQDPAMLKRLDVLTRFMSEHFKLLQVIDATFSKEQNQGKSGFRESALSDLREAYDQFAKQVNVFDLSKDGHESWEVGRKHYDTYTAKIENQLTILLKQKLERAGSANEMF